ncbi:hypothetical protein SETIT_2G005300v2 [Setaria italica]|uniref:DUF4220 domain-containing protein n=1 Tax=Setaria italica TaxID=4555 RepID=A0A368PUP1_SETIT|nr:hypothetical protein SETIT_2G005300v2 [Setaria italica]
MLLSNRTKDLWKSPKGTVIRIELLVVVVVFLQLFLVACGSRRCRTRNFFIQKGVFGAYTLSSSLVSYTLGSMQSSAIKSGMYSLWAFLLGYAYVCMIARTTLDGGSFFRVFSFCYLVSVSSMYFIQRLAACRMASKSWFLNKMVAGYMYQEHTMSREAYDPATMTGYHYLVECRLYSTYIGRAYIGDGKYEHILEGLLAKKKKENDDGGANAAIDYDCIFNVIEIELAFMYDFFFTKYAAIYYGSFMMRYVLPLVLRTLTVVTAFQTARGLLRPPPNKGMEGSVIVYTTAADIDLTVAILVCISFLQVVQVMYYWTTIAALFARNKDIIHARYIRKGHGKPAAVKLPAEVKNALVHSLCCQTRESAATRYCAYLVVSAPKLLPGHHYDTSLVFDAVAVEAARFLRKAEDKHEAMKCLPESTETSIFRKGVKLGRQLEEMEDDKRWKVLADFWAEMLLYVTPSDNVKEHIEFLANGGEFLTHFVGVAHPRWHSRQGSKECIGHRKCRDVWPA